MKKFDDLIEALNLTFKTAPVPDGSYEIELDGEAIDVSWGWDDDTFEQLKHTNPDCIWTVVDYDGKLYVIAGLHYVNRLYYLVTNEPYRSDFESFIF